MELLEISDTKQDEAADGGGMLRNVKGFFTKSKEAGRSVMALKMSSVIDSFVEILHLTSCVLAMSHNYSLLLKDSESPACGPEILFEGPISRLIDSVTRKDSLCGLDVHWALGIQLAILMFYIHRCRVSFNIFRGLCPNVSTSLRLKYFKSWIISSLIFIGIYCFCAILSKDISKMDKVNITIDALRLCFGLYYKFDFYIVNWEIQRKEQNGKKEFSPEV